MPTASESTRIDETLARAVVWRQLALGFLAPAIALARSLDDEADREALDAALRLLGLGRFEARADDLEQRFTRLFGHTVRAAVCPYETEYGAGRVFRQVHELADLQGWYAAFGLAGRESLAERADHIGVECEFAGFLCMKEAWALESGDAEQLEIVRDGYRRFLRDHLARFGIAVSQAIVGIDEEGVYGSLARICRGMLLAECERLEIEPGPRALPLRPDNEDDTPAACGAGAVGKTADAEVCSPLGRAAPRHLLSIGEPRDE